MAGRGPAIHDSRMPVRACFVEARPKAGHDVDD
jgi:hypothetical protein